MKTKMSLKIVAALTLTTALTAGASAQAVSLAEAAQGGVSAHFKDGTPIATGGEYAVQLEAKDNHGAAIGSTSAREVAAHHAEACGEGDYDEAAVEQVYDYNKESGSVAEHGTDSNAKFDLKLNWRKSKAGANGKHCLKDASVTLKKKRADGMDELPAVQVKVKKSESAGALGAFAATAVEFMIRQAAPAGASANKPTTHVKIDSNGAAQLGAAQE